MLMQLYAATYMAERYEEAVLKHSLRPEYVQKALHIQQQKPVTVGSSYALRVMIGLR